MTARHAAFVALIAGITGDILLRGSPWGLGFSIWLVLVVSAALTRVQAGRFGTTSGATPFLVVAVSFGACVALRDQPVLRAWNALGAMLALALALIAARGLPLAAAGVTRYASAALAAATATVTSPIRVGIARFTGPRGGTTQLALRVLLASLLALPLLLLFGALLTSADPLFEHLARRVFGIDVERVMSHAVVVALLTWPLTGYLVALQHRQGVPVRDAPPWLPSFGLVEIGIPMVALTALFATFVGVQAEYLFGGEELVRTTVGLSFAEYARRGFVELVVTSGLIIPVVVGADLFLRKDDPLSVRWFRRIARVQLLCVVLIMVSALSRLRIYYHAYGLTVDRLLAAAVMLWIGCTLGWFAFTVLRGYRKRFPLGVVVAGLAVLAAVDVVNPEAVVVRVNVERAVAGAELDVRYLSRLSADAIPTLTDHAHRLPPAVRTTLLDALANQWDTLDRPDWRSWNLGYQRARHALANAFGT